jgi:molybdate transport system substrate-binding protein
LVAVAVAALGTARAGEGGVPSVAAAADLKYALTEVAERWQQETGLRVSLVFGSSGNAYAQVLQGAPYQVYLSADEAFVFRLAEAGKTVDRGRRYAVGRIGILVPPGSPVKADGELKGLAEALKQGRVKRFAIANPEHAPYGRAAEEALRHAGLWESLRGKLVLGENVSQAAQFATSGSAQGGIIALSVAMAPKVAESGAFAVIPEAWHRPLIQRMVLLKGAGATARAFYDHVGTPPSQAVLARYGFVLPPD